MRNISNFFTPLREYILWYTPLELLIHERTFWYVMTKVRGWQKYLWKYISTSRIVTSIFISKISFPPRTIVYLYLVLEWWLVWEKVQLLLLLCFCCKSRPRWLKAEVVRWMSYILQEQCATRCLLHRWWDSVDGQNTHQAVRAWGEFDIYQLCKV